VGSAEKLAFQVARALLWEGQARQAGEVAAAEQMGRQAAMAVGVL
jgi:hypothetical protein